MHFFFMLRRLAGINGQLPQSTMITEELKFPQKTTLPGWFSDLRTGIYEGKLVAVKTLRVAREDGPSKIRKVRTKNVQLGQDSAHPVPAFLSSGHLLEFNVTPKHLKTDWSSRRYVERAVHHSVRVDDSRQHHGIYREVFREPTRTATCTPCPTVCVADFGESCTEQQKA